MGKIVRNTNFKLSHACDQFIGFQFFFIALIPLLYLVPSLLRFVSVIRKLFY